MKSISLSWPSAWKQSQQNRDADGLAPGASAYVKSLKNVRPYHQCSSNSTECLLSTLSRVPHPPPPCFVVADGFLVLFLSSLFVGVLFSVFKPSWAPKERVAGRQPALLGWLC